MIGRLIRALRRRMIEGDIITIDRTIDGIRKMRAYEEHLERDLDAERAALARKLNALVQDDINRVTAGNVRAMARK